MQNQIQQLQPALVTRPDQVQTWANYEKRPISFDAAVEKVLKARGNAESYEDPGVNGLNTWAFGTGDGETMAMQKIPLRGRTRGEPLALRSTAFRHLCHRLDKIPSDYIAKLPAKLQMANMNYHLARSEGDAVFRMNGDEIRAVVSDRYAAVDDPFYLDIVDDALNRLGYRNDIRVRALATGPNMIMRLTMPSEALEIKSGDIIEYGLDIGNSEIKHRSIQVCPVTWREICTNGMRAWESEAVHKMRHIGDPARLKEQLADAIPVAFAEARGDLKRWQSATEMMVENALDEIESLRGIGMSKRETREVGKVLVGDTGAKNVDELLKDRPTTKYEIANAITEYARDRESVDSRLLAEESGHRYLSRIAV